VGSFGDLVADVVAEVVKTFERLGETKLLTCSATNLNAAIQSSATIFHEEPKGEWFFRANSRQVAEAVLIVASPNCVCNHI